MSYKIFLLSLISLLAFLFGGCLEGNEVDSPKPVIDAWFDSDGYPVVIFTSSVDPSDVSTPVSEKVIRWGKVTLSDGEREIVLTGGPSKDYFPPYRYFTYEMKGEPGKRYRLTAEYKGLYAESECLMMEPTPVNRIEILPSVENDSAKEVYLNFISPEDCPAYYYVGVRNEETKGRALPAMMGTYKATEPGEEIRLQVFRPKNSLDTARYNPEFFPGENLEISLCRVPEEVFDFWVGYDNSVLFGGSQFIDTSQSLRGNIEGGYGIWSVQGVWKEYISIQH